MTEVRSPERGRVRANRSERMRGRRRLRIAEHAASVAIGAAALAAFWAARPQWDPEMRLWKAVGDAALVLLLLTMAIGPLARLWRPARRLLPFRREAGIWFALVAVAHTVLILNGWARWSVLHLLGYEFVPQLGRTARMEPGFGLANIIGLLALVWALALAATSGERALRALGPAAWKWLHNGAYVVFWLTTAHVGYFLFMHYTASFHKQVPPPDWFRVPFLALALIIVALQVAAFVVTVRSRKRTASRATGTGATQASAADAAPGSKRSARK